MWTGTVMYGRPDSVSGIIPDEVTGRDRETIHNRAFVTGGNFV